jgi:fumarate reductase subunit D
VKLIHKLEPIWWMLFGAGAFVAGFVLPALILGVLVLAPLGAMDYGLSYDRAHSLAASPVGKVFLGGVLTLTLWHCAHHMRHFALDLGGHALAPIAAYTSYGLALAGTIATLVIVGSL